MRKKAMLGGTETPNFNYMIYGNKHHTTGTNPEVETNEIE